MEYYSAKGRIEKGSWVYGGKQGEFEVTYENGTTHKVMHKDYKSFEDEDYFDF